ncbi:pleckstrin homology domain-containing family J member 1 isoform X1 [Gracilinanus agilis]|uniref:pleckstrin homology domain-containing family J member 1 isoform X1 n=1 Tax=Gracilinanus agilis TaxID=191870 RepID=UPI001CFDA67C|nr:pleckstrin homology domain-containing family J member 1 isoform X1 [Gracilinanus agilis]
MRFNEKELQALSRQPAEKAAEIGMRVPKKGSVVKRRLVKLVVNFLFYFRTDEAEPIGALLLEHCRIAKEEPSGFSIRPPGAVRHLRRGQVPAEPSLDMSISPKKSLPSSVSCLPVFSPVIIGGGRGKGGKGEERIEWPWAFYSRNPSWTTWIVSTK